MTPDVLLTWIAAVVLFCLSFGYLVVWFLILSALLYRLINDCSWCIRHLQSTIKWGETVRMEKVFWDQNLFYVFFWVERCMLIHFLCLFVFNLSKNYRLILYTSVSWEKLKPSPCALPCAPNTSSLWLLIHFFCPAKHYFSIPSGQIHAWRESGKCGL